MYMGSDGFIITPRRGATIGVLVAALAGPAMLPAQSAMDRLNQILGREIDPRRKAPPTRATRPTRPQPRPSQAYPSSALPEAPPPIDTPLDVRPAVGGIGFVDYALLFKLHPVMRYLRLDPQPDATPMFVKGGVSRMLEAPPSVRQAKAAERAAWRREREDRLKELNRLMDTFNRYPATVAQALRKLPRGASPARRQQEEKDYYSRKARMKEDIDKVAIRISQLDTLLEGERRPGPAVNEEYFRRIRHDLDTAIRREYQARQLALVLNVPRERSYFGSARNQARPETRGQTNFFTEFLEGKTGISAEAGIQLSLLSQWEQALKGYDDFLPSDVTSAGVVAGGIDLNASVLTQVWKRYKMSPEQIEVGKRFVSQSW